MFKLNQNLLTNNLLAPLVVLIVNKFNNKISVLLSELSDIIFCDLIDWIVDFKSCDGTIMFNQIGAPNSKFLKSQFLKRIYQ